MLVICLQNAFGFWTDGHIKEAWTQHKESIEKTTASYPSAHGAYKMAFWAANEAYKLADSFYYDEDKSALIQSYLGLSYNILGKGSGFGGITERKIDDDSRTLAKKALTILGLMTEDSLFDFDEKSPIPTKEQRQRLKEFVKKVRNIKFNEKLRWDYYYTSPDYNTSDYPKSPEGLKPVGEAFEEEIRSLKINDVDSETVYRNLYHRKIISLSSSGLKEETALEKAITTICPGCKDMQKTSAEMEEWWQSLIKKDPTGRTNNFVKAYGDSFDTYATERLATSKLRYLKAGKEQDFSLGYGIDFNIYIPKNVKPGAPVVFIVYDGIKAERLHSPSDGFMEESVLAHAGCIVVRVLGMKNEGIPEPDDINSIRYHYNNFPNQIFKDIEDIYIALRDQTFLKKDGSRYPQLIRQGQTKVFLHGTSFGGYMTMMAATSDYVMEKAIPGKPFKDLFDGYIPYAGIYDLAQDQLSLQLSEANVNRRRAALERNYETRKDEKGERFKISQATLYFKDDPIQKEEANKRMSPLYRLDRLSRPVLLMHGFRDTNVGVDAALNLLRAIREAGKEHLVDPTILSEHEHDFDGSGMLTGSAIPVMGMIRDESKRVNRFKEYFDNLLHFIRQVQAEKKPHATDPYSKVFKKLGQRIAQDSQENGLLDREKGKDSGPLRKLKFYLREKLSEKNETLKDLLFNPTESKILEYAKNIGIYEDRNFIDFGPRRPDVPESALNKGSQERLINLFMHALIDVAILQRELLDYTFGDDKALSMNQILWLEQKVAEDLKSTAPGSSRKEAFDNMKKKLSDDTIIAYLRSLPNFIGISGNYEITRFFYQAQRKKIRQAIRNMLFPGEWLYDIMKKETSKELSYSEFSGYSESFPVKCKQIGRFPVASDETVRLSGEAFTSFRKYSTKLSTDRYGYINDPKPAQKRLLALSQEDFIKAIHPYCVKLATEQKEAYIRPSAYDSDSD
jgi:fermentation-respiration switch protein FrsA (DUF1100 family)